MVRYLWRSPRYRLYIAACRGLSASMLCNSPQKTETITLNQLSPTVCKHISRKFNNVGSNTILTIKIFIVTLILNSPPSYGTRLH
ncbi:unnamed protein product [Haemonchus placei]|uniref:Uncharacterized protein n=1 Tax=Haemonchus placei TaxID=6290 RepID=A0A3P7WMR9_HAEPC|nr:unnamed protein product [Haemonchus placei]